MYKRKKWIIIIIFGFITLFLIAQKVLQRQFGHLTIPVINLSEPIFWNQLNKSYLETNRNDKYLQIILKNSEKYSTIVKKLKIRDKIKIITKTEILIYQITHIQENKNDLLDNFGKDKTLLITFPSNNVQFFISANYSGKLEKIS